MANKQNQKHILIIADPISTFKIEKDTTYAIMCEAKERGHKISICEPKNIKWDSINIKVQAQINEIEIQERPHAQNNWYKIKNTQCNSLKDYDAVLMRKDPPFDSEYFYATHLLSQAKREGALIINEPASLREHPEKLAIMEFPQFTSPTLITRDANDIKEFHKEHKDIICKPLDGMGGAGIFRIKEDGLNMGAIIESLNNHGQTTIMIQKYLPQISEGDKRILIIDGKPAPWCLARIPQNGEVRGNLAAGGKGVAQPLNSQDEKTAREIGTKLAPRGLILIGLDVIGDKVTEINVTSPTGFQEIQKQTGFSVASMYMDAIENQIQKSQK